MNPWFMAQAAYLQIIMMLTSEGERLRERNGAVMAEFGPLGGGVRPSCGQAGSCSFVVSFLLPHCS
jgi:hypothetical protein